MFKFVKNETMIRTTITPVTTQIYLSIPKKYLGKKVEVLLYTIEESEPVISVTIKKKPSDYAGTLLPDAAVKLLSHIEQSRNEWEKDT